MGSIVVSAALLEYASRLLCTETRSSRSFNRIGIKINIVQKVRKNKLSAATYRVKHMMETFICSCLIFFHDFS